jgi:hypothetical protein
VNAEFLPLKIVADTDFSVLRNAYLPGAVVHYGPLKSAYVAYPSANAIIELYLPGLVPAARNSRNIVVFQ